MITFQSVTSIDDTEFNVLYEASSFYMDRSNYPYWIHGLRDPEARRQHIRAEFDRWLTDGVVWRVSDGGLALGLSGGELADNRLTWYQSLVGPNAADSRSYLYDDAYIAARNAWLTSLGATSWVVEITGQDNSMHEYYKQLRAEGKLGSSDAEEITDAGSGLSIVRITVTV